MRIRRAENAKPKPAVPNENHAANQRRIPPTLHQRIHQPSTDE